MSNLRKIFGVFGAIALASIVVANPKKTVEILEAVNDGLKSNNTSTKSVTPQKNYGVIRTGYFKCTDAIKRFFRWIW